MPQPHIGSVHVDAILTQLSVAYLQSAENFIANKVFPIVPVDKQSDKFFTYPKNDWFRDEAEVRAPGTESAGSGYGLSTDNYSCDTFALHKDVDDPTVRNSDAPLNPFRDAANFVAQRMLLRQEVQFVSDFLTTGKWGTDVAGVSGTPGAGEFKQWSDFAASDPIEDVEGAKEGVLSTTGMDANTLILGYQVFRKLKNHPDILDRIKYTTSQTVTADMLARMFDVERVLVTKAVKATNKEGGAGAYSFAVGKIAWLGHVAPAPGLLTPSAGYTFAWKGVSEGLGASIGTSQFRMEHLKATRVESEIAFDNKIVAPDLGYFMSSVVA